MKTTDDVTLGALLVVLGVAFHIEGNMEAMPLDYTKPLLHLVVATEEGVMMLRLKQRD